MEILIRDNPNDAQNNKIGEIDSLIVKRFGILLNVWQDDKLVALASVELLSNSSIIDDVWISEENRGQKLFVKILLFIKNELKQKKIIFGVIHSDDTVNLLKRDGLKAFKKYWATQWDGKTEPFSPDTVDDFYGVGKWKLVLENNDNWTEFVKINSFTHSYDALVNVISLNENLV